MSHWVKTRLTPVLEASDGKKVRFLLGERDDGGVFCVVISWDAVEPKFLDAAVEMAFFTLNNFLDEPLSEKSVGRFDVDPNIYLPGMSPGKV